MIDEQIDYRWEMLQLRLFEKRISEAFAFFRQNHIEPILIKGWAAAQNYPQQYRRQFSDIDLMIAPDRYADAVSLVKQFKDWHLVDLHCGARRLDCMPFEKLFAGSKTIKCGGAEVRVLRSEDHLRILCVHWLNDGGENQEKLWDIYYALENRPPDFDWDRCFNQVGAIRKGWLICTVAVAEKYLNFNLNETPLAGVERKIPKWMIDTLEQEWGSDTPRKPLHYCLNDKKEFFRQIKKRIPPNAIQATVEMEGDFDDTSRIKYQLRDILYRVKSSAKRLTNIILEKHKPSYLQRAKISKGSC